MDLELIRGLAQVLSEQGLSTLKVCEGDWQVTLEKATPAMTTATVPAAVSAAPVQAIVTADEDGVAPNYGTLTEVTSPVVGVFYAAASPTSEPFVAVGSKVQRGDVLCIVEAMKLMNEIIAEVDGEIVDICVRNGDIVEFGQPLFKMH